MRDRVRISDGRRGGCLDDLVARGLGTPVVCVIDGHAGLRKAVGLVWPEARVQRCAVHKLRNLERKAPKHALAELRADFHGIVYAENISVARSAYAAFERQWTPRYPGVVRSLREGGEELLTFFAFPKAQWKTLRTHEQFRRRAACRPRTRHWSFSSASWLAARSGCGASMGGATSRRCSARGGEAWHDASRIGTRIAFDGQIHTRVASKSPLSGNHALRYTEPLDFDRGLG